MKFLIDKNIFISWNTLGIILSLRHVKRISLSFKTALHNTIDFRGGENSMKIQAIKIRAYSRRIALWPRKGKSFSESISSTKRESVCGTLINASLRQSRKRPTQKPAGKVLGRVRAVCFALCTRTRGTVQQCSHRTCE